MIRVKNMSFDYYNTNVLQNINLTINKNDKVLLVGHNGAGKSTLIRLLAGLHNTFNYEEFEVIGRRSPMDQFHGLVYLGNRWIRNLAFVGSTPYVADIKVENMMVKLQEKYSGRRDELIEVLGVDLEWKMHKISDGERKKVQIMLALLKPFKLVLIDEFISELDILVRDRLFTYLNKEKATILYATHVFDDIDKWITHVVYLSNGTCESKVSLKDFLQGDTIYNRVKEKLLVDRHKMMHIDDNFINLGPQGGWGSGRSSNIVYPTI